MTGKRLAAARLALHKTQAELASEIGVERNALANWEGGTRLAAVEAMLKLMATHRVTLEWIYAGQLAGMPTDLQSEVFAAASRLGITAGTDEGAIGVGGYRRAQRPAAKAGSLHERKPPPIT